ncbi:tRNA synthetases class I-domain-containing protein [Pisolithus orientalis]|uniref:tRNA synthetases class I-domain-containing protein n=1 Tax=Pisolithus orientalis TaxID=936130 RepID=UPI002224E093|nr:tRNA synthetases class I-domain-containing protein [Pisolithus orientalis]KAI5996433.1 tRNA synthetases class I-domain-containing protein [Pisolithus orientalis]
MSLCALTHATRLPLIRFGCFRLSTLSPGQKLDPKAFSKTLLLPKTSFPLWPDPSKTELPFRKKTCDDLYRWQVRHGRGPLFVLHDGPPYANGHLHIGHALNKILKDIINRYHVSIGDRVQSGDPHTLAPDTIRNAARATAEREMLTQQEEFKQFGIMAEWSPGSTYRTLDHAYEMRQLRVFQQMVSKGLIYRHYRPVYYSPSSRSALAEAELVYKDDHVSHAVYVSFTVDAMGDLPSLAGRLASSNAREEVMGELRRGMVKFLVWTTTPWTLTANMGIAVHSDLTYVVARSQRHRGLFILAKERLAALERILGSYSEIKVISEIPGSQLVGLRYRGIFSLPSARDVVSHRHSFQVISAAHMIIKYSVRKGLLDSGLLCHVDGEGKFSGNVRDIVSGIEGGEDLVGLEVLKGGSKAIVALLERTGSLLSVERFRHRYPYDWKTNEPVIVTATSQWFANLDDIKEDALAALDNVAFYPPSSQNRLTSFVRSRSEWCISRQRVWGVPIPALHHIPSGASILTASSLTHILGVLDRKGVGYWWDGPVSEFVSPELVEQYGGEVSGRTWRKSTDTMDVWFDSGTSWTMLPFGEEHERTHRADVCLEGSDQHRGWFQSQLLTAVEKAASPYGTLITHGMVLDESGRKMSKSLGNVDQPLDTCRTRRSNPRLVRTVLRLWAATVEYWRDMSIGPTVLVQTAESMRKIRNSARFILGNIGATKRKMRDQGLETLPPIAKENLGLAERTTALQGYATYNFPRVMTALVNFSNYYTLDVLYANDICSVERRAVVDTLERILRTMTSVLAPVLPHLAEEIHGQHAEDARLSFFTQKWTPLSAEWSDCLAEKDMESLLGVRSVVLTLLERARGDKYVVAKRVRTAKGTEKMMCRNLKSALEAKVTITLPSDTNTELVQLLKREGMWLARYLCRPKLMIIVSVFLEDAVYRL